MTMRLHCNALPSQTSEVHVYSMNAEQTHFQMVKRSDDRAAYDNCIVMGSSPVQGWNLFRLPLQLPNLLSKLRWSFALRVVTTPSSIYI